LLIPLIALFEENKPKMLRIGRKKNEMQHIFALLIPELSNFFFALFFFVPLKLLAD